MKVNKRLIVQRHFGLVLVALLFPVCYIMAADVKGKVTDASNAALSGVTIVVKGSNISTTSDGSGSFSIEANPSNVLVFSYVGFDSKEVTVGNQTFLTIALSEKKDALGEVVVVGYGSQNRKALVSSVTTIKSEDLNRGAISDVGQLLQGKVPGLNISKSGDPNRASAIILRGASTLKGRCPIAPFCN